MVFFLCYLMFIKLDDRYLIMNIEELSLICYADFVSVNCISSTERVID